MATFIPANIDIPWAGLENGAIVNDDGHGWAIASKKHGLEVGKSMSYDIAALTLAAAREKHGPDSLVVFHSRFATHGETNEFNVHPFYVGAGDGDVVTDTVMAHNGILPTRYHPDRDDPRSDTRVFGDTVAPAFVKKDDGVGVPSRRGGKMMGDMIGSGNKLVFLTVKDGTPKVRIVNAHLGTFSGGVWYSNDGFCPWEERYSGYTSRWSSSTTGLSNSWGGTASSNKFDEPYKPKSIQGGGVEGRDYCGFCQSTDIDLASSMCVTCEMCLDCKDWIGDCSCYLSPSEEEAIDARVGAQMKGKQVNLWTPDSSPLNPRFVPAEVGIEV